MDKHMLYLKALEGLDILEGAIKDFEPYLDVTDLKHAQSTLGQQAAELRLDLDNELLHTVEKPSSATIIDNVVAVETHYIYEESEVPVRAKMALKEEK